VGLTAYVVPAAIGYVSIGGKTLSAVAALLAHDGHSAVGPVVIGLFIGIACVVLQAAPHSGGRAALVSILQMVASWAACIAILMTLPGWSALPVLLFAVTTGAVLVRTGVARSTGAIRGGLEPEHRVGVVI